LGIKVGVFHFNLTKFDVGGVRHWSGWGRHEGEGGLHNVSRG